MFCYNIRMRHYVALALLVTVFTVPWAATTFPEQTARFVSWAYQVGDQVAAVIVHNPRTVAGLQQKYAIDAGKGATKIRILLVPGHEPGFGGAEYGSMRERNMTVDLADELATFLSTNNKYQVLVARDKDQWNPVFQTYFKQEWDNIIAWQKDHRQESLRKVESSAPLPAPKVLHNRAPNDVAYRLYGLTKWSNENNIDIAIHIHFNDYPGHSQSGPGEYTGFAIYSPEKQYANSTTTRAIARTIFRRLNRYNPVSDLPAESDGIIEERELIAVGANDTADAASLLVEYGYIYEPQFTNQDAYKMAIKDLAFQTYLGLEDFFNPQGSSSLAAVYDTLVLPHTWRGALSETANQTQDVYALQTALLVDGVYPPKDKSKNDCPRTGRIGPCTKTSVEAFQKKYGIDESGVGQKTIEVLNKYYSGAAL
jgi:N-acetylmuramoyl-L-alanine amidase